MRLKVAGETRTVLAMVLAREAPAAQRDHLIDDGWARRLSQALRATIGVTCRNLGDLLDLFSPAECANYLSNAGYSGSFAVMELRSRTAATLYAVWQIFLNIFVLIWK